MQKGAPPLKPRWIKVDNKISLKLFLERLKVLSKKLWLIKIYLYAGLPRVVCFAPLNGGAILYNQLMFFCS